MRAAYYVAQLYATQQLLFDLCDMNEWRRFVDTYMRPLFAALARLDNVHPGNDVEYYFSADVIMGRALAIQMMLRAALSKYTKRRG